MNQIKQLLEKFRVNNIRPSVSQQKEFEELIFDISARDNITMTQIISDEIDEIINDEKLSSPIKLKRIKNVLLRMRYPIYIKAKRDFQTKLKEQKLHPKINVKATPYFENEKIEIDYEYENEEELAEIKKSIEKLKEANLIGEVLKDAENNC